MLSTTLELKANPFLSPLQVVNRAVSGFQDRLIKFGLAFQGVTAAVDLVRNAFAKLSGTIDLGGDLTDLSAETGETVSNLLIFQQALKNTRLGAEGMGPLIAKWQKALAGLNEEGKPTTKTLKELGLSSEDLVNKSVIDQVGALGQAFRGIEDQATRAKLAQELFGGKGTKFLALLTDEGAIGQATTQVGGLAATMEKLAPTLDTIGDAVGGISLKFQQLTAGALSIAAPHVATFSEALNQVDLTGIGVALGHVALAVIKIGEVVSAVFPVLLSLGAGYVASWASAAIAAKVGSASIVGSVRAVSIATVAGMRSIMAALGPLGLGVAGITFLWQKFREKTDKPIAIQAPETPAFDRLAQINKPATGGPVSNLARIGGAFAGMTAADPVSSRIDRTNQLLGQINSHMQTQTSFMRNGNRPPVAV